MTGSPSRNKIGNYYFYYTCRNRVCEQYGKSLNNKKINGDFCEHLKRLKMEEYWLDFLEDVIKDVWSSKESALINQEAEQTKRLRAIAEEIKTLKEKICNASSDSIVEIYMEKLESLTEEKDTLEVGMKMAESQKINVEKLITNTKSIFLNPLCLREKNNLKFKKLMLSVFFSNEIFRDKKNGIQTPCIPLIYSLFSDKFDKSSLWWVI